MKLNDIKHVFAICDENNEKNRYDFLKNWMDDDFGSNYYTISAYCYKNTLSDYDIEKYKIKDNMHNGNKSLCINHLKIFEYILKNYNNGENFLIFESDAVPVENYVTIFNTHMGLLKNKEWDYLDLGNGCNLLPTIFGHHIDEKTNDIFLCKTSRCAHSIVWSYSGMLKFYNQILKNEIHDVAVDWVYNRVIKELDANVYWSHPHSFIQGSQCSIYNSVNYG
jgi:hypothetical protein